MVSYLLGLDVGTTATKGVLLEQEGGLVASSEVSATLHSPHVSWAEADPEEWWTNIGEVTRRCLSQAGIGGKEVAAVGVSGMVPTLILTDQNGNILRPSIQQNDARAFQEIVDFRERVDEAEVLERTGNPITQQCIGPKFLWLAQHEPERIKHTSHLMGSYDYIVYKLTGSFSCEQNWALESGLFDLYSRDWNERLLDLSLIQPQWLGKVHRPSDIVGELTPEAAAHTGLSRGTPVVAGSADHVASAFAAGLTSSGDLLVKLGGAGDILYCLDQLLVDPRLFLDYHIVPGKYLLNGCMAASGSIIKWFRQQFAPEMEYSDLDSEGRDVPPGSCGLVLLPYFLGEKTPINDPLARGVIFGLTLSHSRSHIYRAILEGIAYGFKHHVAVLTELGLRIRRVRVTNGGARSYLWKQITADVIGLPLEHLPNHPGSSLGAAFVAGVGVGVFDEWSDIERFIEKGVMIEPDMTAHSRYQKLFAIYRDLYDSLKGKFPDLLKAGGDEV